MQPLNVYEQIVDLLGRVYSGNSGVEKLKSEHTWRHFTPPLYNFAVTATEVFLENNFLENVKNADGKAYSTKKAWIDDIDGFLNRYNLKGYKREINKGFSFQRLKSVDVLYSKALDVSLNGYSKYELIELLFAKRHLFTHRGGLIDEKFIEKHNFYHKNNSQY